MYWVPQLLFSQLVKPDHYKIKVQYVFSKLAFSQKKTWLSKHKKLGGEKSLVLFQRAKNLNNSSQLL